jgi:hypothetical protein
MSLQKEQRKILRKRCRSRMTRKGCRKGEDETGGR